MLTLEESFRCERALVFGIGGSGDIVGSIPTARLLELHGVDVLLGGTTWEPVPKDSKPGPRSFDEILNLDKISTTVGLATGETRTHDGLEFTETYVARHYSTEVALIDMSKGAEGMRVGVEEACTDLDLDLVVGVDAGGDVLARGDELGLRSPVTDGFGLATLETLSAKTLLGVFGYGSDGELTLDELEAGIVRAAERDGLLGAWGLTRRVRDELEAVLETVETEASRLPVEAAQGAYGQKQIRGGDVSLRLTPPSTVTFYFDPAAVISTSKIVSLVNDSRSIDEATAALKEAGYRTEFEIERDRLESHS
ncbi:DUF1152 domain-containing protein [Haladaptatus halobius]|uniref:DUF1152 domain-containing protein n=1 Tax=Haladaptatus halobius TaxID=2884875 RepID=UPI001D0B59A0|nr:DUF1152 domain-containing protein [Haladaptatus halobius]